MAPGVICAQSGAGAGEAAAPDSVRTYPAKMPARSTWEKVLSAPGTIANLPFELLFAGIGGAVKFAQEAPSLAPLRDLLIPRIRIRGVLPTASGRSGVGLKYYINHPLGDSSRLTLNVKHGIIDRRQKHYAELRDIPLGGRFYATTKLEYRIFHNESFFGLGPDSDFSNRSVYDLEQTTADFHLALRTDAQTAILATAGFSNQGVQPGDHNSRPELTRVAPDSLSGLDGRTKLFSAGLAFNHDSRDNRAMTYGGWLVQTRLGLFSQIQGDDYRYWDVLIDVTRYFHLFYGRRLSLRVAAERKRPLSDRSVPFFNLSELGSRETIRGHSRGRFRDLDKLLWSVEYRYPIWHYFDAVLFLDGGQVSNDILDRFKFRDFELSYGGGFLIRSHNDPVLQFLVGASKDQVRFYLVLN